MVNGTESIEDIRKAPEDGLSFISAANEASSLQLFTFMDPNFFQLASSATYLGQGHPVALNAHEALVTYITRNLPFIIPDIRDEMISSFNDAMDTAGLGNSSGMGVHPVSHLWP